MAEYEWYKRGPNWSTNCSLHASYKTLSIGANISVGRRIFGVEW